MIMGRIMKDSGIAWIGEIPEHWDIHPVYLYFDERKSTNYKMQEQNLLSLSYGNIIRKDINTNGGLLPISFTTYNIVEKRDIIIRPTDLQNDKKSLRTGLVKERGIITSAYIALKPKYSHSSRFYHYMLHAADISKVFYNMGNGVRQGLNYSEFSKLQILSPSPDEQETIADYLDKKTADIDAAIKEAQELIEKYKAYKQSIITEIVTKGLNPNVTMKDSGVEWIGEIPEHWGCHPVYVYFDERKNSNYRMQEQNLLSLSYGKIIRKDINTNGGLLPVSFTTYNIVEDGDIIIRPTDLQNDKKSLRTGLVKERGIITSAYIALKPKFLQSSRYYHYMLHTADVCKVFYNMGNGVRQGLNYSEFSKLMMISPSVSEQEAIADYLDDKCAKIDSIITDKETLISRLQEYKKSIIFEYVTGKKQVE